MNTNETFVGQIDLLSLVGARLEKISGEECIVVPVSSNPSIYRRQTQKGQQKAELDFIMRPTSNGLNGNTHFVKANVGTANREKMGLSKDEVRQYSPIMGNAKPLISREVTRPSVTDDDDLPEGEFKGF